MTIKRYNTYVLDLDLTIARTDILYFTGLMNTLLVRSIDDLGSNLSIKFDKQSNQSIVLHYGDVYNFNDPTKQEHIDFERVYLSNTAVGAGSAQLIFGHNIEIQKLLRITADIVQDSILQQVVNVGLAATPLPAASLAQRINLLLYNPVGGNTVYIGSATVTAALATQGMPLLAGASLSLNVAQGVTVYGIAAIAQDINILEGA